MVNIIQLARIRIWLTSFGAAGGILALFVSPYRLEEILACWLFFSLVFALVVLAILLVVAFYSTVEGVLHWVHTVSARVSKAPLGVSHLHPQ